MTRWGALVQPFVLVSVLASAALAAEGTVSGVVLDSGGAVLPDALLLLRRSDLQIIRFSRSGADGRFRLEHVEPGSYSLTVSKQAFSDRTLVVEAGIGAADVVVQLSVSSVVSQVTVTAETGRLEDIQSIPQRVNVVARSGIDRRVATVVADSFREEAGLDVQRTGPFMGGVSVRGLLGKNIAVYKDGVRYTTSAQRGGVSTFFNLNEPAALESIEVLRGPNSAQYSSDSMGGTVNFLSRPANTGGDGWSGDVSPFYSSPANAFGASARTAWSGKRIGWTTVLSGTRVNTLRAGQGIDTHAAVTRFLGLPSTVLGDRLSDTGFTQYGGMTHGVFSITDRQQLAAHYERNQQDGAKRPDQLLGGDGNLIAGVRNVMLDFGYLRYTNFRAGWLDQASATLSYNAQREQRVNQGGNGNPAASITSQYERTEVWGTSFYVAKQIQKHGLLAGGDGYREREVSPAFTLNPVNGAVSASRPRIPDGGRYLLYGAYLQDVWEPWQNGRLRISGAVRFGGASYRSRAGYSPLVNGLPLWPDDSAAANNVTGRLGAVWRVTPAFRVHANYGRGFRAPGMTDLSTVGIQGNGFFEASAPDLAGRGATVGNRADDRAISSGKPVQQVRSETSDNYELGAQFAERRFRSEVTGFIMQLRDTIVSQTLILPQGAVGQMIGDQTIVRQLATGAVFVPAATAPVLVRGNLGRVRIHGVEHSLEADLTRGVSFAANTTWIYGRDRATGAPPDIEGGMPPLTSNLRLGWARGGRFWSEAYVTIAGRQDRLSSLALADRRTGASRSRSNISNFFNNGARIRGLVQNGILLPTGETLAQVQQRVLGPENSAPMFTAVPGYVLTGIRGGFRTSERTDILFDVSNLLDKSYRGVSWGIDGAGRGITLRYRYRL